MEKRTPEVKRRGPSRRSSDSSPKSVERRVLQKNFTSMYKTVTGGEVPEELFARGIIDQTTLEFTMKQTNTERERGHNVMHELMRAVEVKPDLFEEICSVLEAESTEPPKEIARNLRRDHGNMLKAERQRNGTTGDFDDLKSRLGVHCKELAMPEAPQDSIHECIKFAVYQYVKTTLSDDAKSTPKLKDQMQKLCYELLIPSSLHSWVLELVDRVSQQLTAIKVVPEASIGQSTKEPRPPLFCKDTLYHASVCCHVVSTCDPRNIQAFLRSCVSGHSLKEVSISEDQEGIDRYLVAKEGNTLYVAFQSELTLSTWVKKHSTFDGGLKQQTKRIPLRFFAEQLLASKRIVLTGFSFGGMLACCVAANIWKKSCLPTDVLEKNVICITFGQPLMTIAFVQEVIRMFPTFEKTIHSVFDKRDLVPRILRYFTVGCTQSKMSPVLPSTVTKPATVPEGQHVLSFEGTFATGFLGNLATLQDTLNPEQTYSGVVSNQNTAVKNAVQELKKSLESVLPHAKTDSNMVMGMCYLISQGHDLEWKPVQKQEFVERMGHLDKATVDKTGSTIFKQHNMDDYRHSIFNSYLKMEPSPYKVPRTPKEVKGVGILKPQVKTVEFHEFPTEHVLVLEGDCLWFCHSITLSEGSNKCTITTPAQDITQRSIQFTFVPTDQKRLLGKDGRMKVTLYTHFEVVVKRVEVKQEPYTFSPRQIQLAKHTPSEIIQLAYWSALLEWYPDNDDKAPGIPSKRFKQIAEFLEEVVRVVPIESVFYAIAYGDHDTALECAKAVAAFQPKTVFSTMMLEGSRRAALRMSTGVPPGILDDMIAEALRTVPFGIPMVTNVQRNDAGNVEVSVESIIPTLSGLLIPVPSVTTVANVVVFPSPPNTELSCPASDEVVECLGQLSKNVFEKAQSPLLEPPDVVCNMSIEQVYPAQPVRRQTLHQTTLPSPIEVLRRAREKLATFIKESREAEGLLQLEDSKQSTETSNKQMLDLVRSIFEQDLKLCATLLGAFMEQRICIPVVESPMDTAKALSANSAPVAVGVWALFSMSYEELDQLLAQVEGNSLLVEIVDYIAGIFSEEPSQIRDSRYAAKLQFLLQGVQKTVSCSSQYISYCLEHQLCNNTKISKCKSITIKALIKQWDEIFKGDALSLIAKSHRPLIARWLKWAILVHGLREALAKYSCIGVAGLVNSGKSRLVNSLFKVKTLVGTTDVKRTTIPFMYNLDGVVDGLDVIDFPGVDDKDHSVPGLAKLMIGLAQVVIFVVNYSKVLSDPSVEWIRALQREHVPVLVCLTHADRLYAECITNEHGKQEATPYKEQVIRRELETIKDKLGHHPSRTVDFYCFYQEPDSSLTDEMLGKVGIGFPCDVGTWLVETFEKLDQKDLATRLRNFVQNKTQQDPTTEPADTAAT